MADGGVVARTGSHDKRAAASLPSPSIRPSRLAADADVDVQRGIKLSKDPMHDVRQAKGKEPIRGDGHVHLGREHYVPSPQTPRPNTTDGLPNSRNKFRGSLLVAASDALGLKFGRRRPSIRQPPMPIILPDVIEISAPRADAEVEERNRLREMAAQSIGLAPYVESSSNHHREDSTDDDEYHLPQDSAEFRRPAFARNSEPNIAARSPHGSSLSIAIPPASLAHIQPTTPISHQHHSQPLPPLGGRFRSGSMLAQSPSHQTTIAPIPPYPSSLSSLNAFQQCSGMYSKYYPPSSLRIFALSKNWKYRYLILSSPATLVTRGQGPAVSYLHLFKSGGQDEKELERLEINEESVVFVAEEEVGGRRQVIKVGGVDSGAMRKEYLHEEGGHTMWLLHIPDQADAQTWITNIKNAILGQRTVRAGLIPAHTLSGNEPRGDMDVMLSIRAQNHLTSTSPTTPKFPANSSPVAATFGDANGAYASSISSQSGRSQVNAPKPPSSPTSAVSALKGLFANSARPRSSSRAASVDYEQRSQEKEVGEESFTSIGSNLLNMLRSSTPDTQSITTIPGTTPSRMNLPYAPVSNMERRIDRKIVVQPPAPPIQWASSEPSSSGTLSSVANRANRALSLGALSLQPPPRKRWTSVGQSTPTNALDARADDIMTVGSGKRSSLSLSRVSTEKSFDLPRASVDLPRASIDLSRPSVDTQANTEPPSSPGHASSNFQFGTPEQRPRAPSLQSISTFASADNAASTSSVKRTSRRWSKGVLPTRLTPPSDPPPAIPMQPPASPVASTMDRSIRPNSMDGSQKSVVSGLPNFSKRTSGSDSIYSSISTQSNPGANPGRSSAHRASIAPPPRPAPTSALPPAPMEAILDDSPKDVLKPLESIPTPPSKSTFRPNSRGSRLSLLAPKPPPSTTLPPRPDEAESAGNFGRTHRRSSSSGTTSSLLHGHISKLDSIPASPIAHPRITNPFPPPLAPLPPAPPPSGPLPPPPHATETNAMAGQAAPRRNSSFKQRLRLLSTSSLSSTPGKISLPRSMASDQVVVAAHLTTSPPATPIAEKITLFQNDPSFLQMYTPIMPPLEPPPGILALQTTTPQREQEVAEVTSLLPPPRRGSKQLLDMDLESQRHVMSWTVTEEKSEKNEPTVEVPKRLSLSRPGSPLSHRSQLHREDEMSSPGSLASPSLASPDDFPSPDEKLPSPLLDTRHHVSSRPGSVISLGIMTI